MPLSFAWPTSTRRSWLRLPMYVKAPFLLCFLMSSVMVLTLLVLFFSLQPEVPLFYSLPQPNDYLAPKQWLAVLPAFSFIVTFLHIGLLRTLRHYEIVIQQIFAWVTVVVQVIIALAFFRIIIITM